MLCSIIVYRKMPRTGKEPERRYQESRREVDHSREESPTKEKRNRDGQESLYRSIVMHSIDLYVSYLTNQKQ